MTIDLIQYLKQNPFVLAPMAGITDSPFRSFMREMGAGVVVSELVSANGLKYASDRTRRLCHFEEAQRPVGIQLFGETPENIAEGAKWVEDQGADFVDLNFGCPVNKVVKNGAGAAVLRDLVQLRAILRTVRSAIAIPLTIKIRTGWDDQSRNAIDVAQVAYDEGIAWVAIHGRTRTQAYTGLADWDYIAEVKSKAKLPILGNGDIQTAQEANRRLQESGCDGVLIGRGCLKNPWIFRQSVAIYQKTQQEIIKEKFEYVFSRLHDHLLRSCEERTVLLQLKIFSAWYSTGYPNAAIFRKKLFQCNDHDQILGAIGEYYANVDLASQSDTRHEAFLMGGHG
jgi:nifR3 family TIM-barrel protein